jgi:aconitate hydratase
VDDTLQPQQEVLVDIITPDGPTRTITTTCRIDTPVEIDYYRNGGILQTVLRNLLKEKGNSYDS